MYSVLEVRFRSSMDETGPSTTTWAEKSRQQGILGGHGPIILKYVPIQSRAAPGTMETGETVEQSVCLSVYHQKSLLSAPHSDLVWLGTSYIATHSQVHPLGFPASCELSELETFILVPIHSSAEPPHPEPGCQSPVSGPSSQEEVEPGDPLLPPWGHHP